MCVCVCMCVCMCVCVCVIESSEMCVCCGTKNCVMYYKLLERFVNIKYNVVHM